MVVAEVGFAELDDDLSQLNILQTVVFSVITNTRSVLSEGGKRDCRELRIAKGRSPIVSSCIPMVKLLRAYGECLGARSR